MSKETYTVSGAIRFGTGYTVSGAIEIRPADLRLEDGDTVTHETLLAAGQTEEHIAQLIADGDLVVPGEE